MWGYTPVRTTGLLVLICYLKQLFTIRFCQVCCLLDFVDFCFQQMDLNSILQLCVTVTCCLVATTPVHPPTKQPARASPASIRGDSPALSNNNADTQSTGTAGKEDMHSSAGKRTFCFMAHCVNAT